MNHRKKYWKLRGLNENYKCILLLYLSLFSSMWQTPDWSWRTLLWYKVSGHHGGGGCGSGLEWLVARKWERWAATLHIFIIGQEGGCSDRNRTWCHTSRDINDPLLLEIPQVSKRPQTPRAAMPAGYHVFKRMSPWRACYSQTEQRYLC